MFTDLLTSLSQGPQHFQRLLHSFTRPSRLMITGNSATAGLSVRYVSIAHAKQTKEHLLTRSDCVGQHPRLPLNDGHHTSPMTTHSVVEHMEFRLLTATSSRRSHLQSPARRKPSMSRYHPIVMPRGCYSPTNPCSAWSRASWNLLCLWIEYDDASP